MDFDQFLHWFEIAWRSDKIKIKEALKHRQKTIQLGLSGNLLQMRESRPMSARYALYDAKVKLFRAEIHWLETIEL